MHPVIAFTLLELLIIIAIIAIAAAILGPKIAELIGKSKKAAGNRVTVASWVNPAPTIPINTPTDFNLLVKLERRDSGGAVLGTDIAPEHTSVLFDLKMIRGTGQVVSATAAGSALPQAKTATVGNPANNVLGTTDTNGSVTITIQLEENSQCQLIPHESPDPALPGWTGPTITVTSNP